jgi:RimJ/RimL family protein N-acetyltransferase
MFDSSQQPPIVYKEGQILITVNKWASEPAIDLLKRTVYGTHGPRYQQTGQEIRARHLTEPFFFDLYVQDQLAGTYCLSGRQVSIAEGRADSFYGRYFAIDPIYGSRGYGSLLKRQAIQYIQSITHQPHLFYSYIEESNERSHKISLKDGYTSKGILEALIFSRLYPKMEPAVIRLDENELAQLMPLLHTTYQSHTLVQFDRVYYNRNYFVLKEKGEIIAGAQAIPVLWRMVAMPGLSGQLIMHLLPHIPVLNRLFNPNKYQFVALEAVYMKSGREDALLRLLESILAHFGYTSALWMVDIHSPIGQTMKSTGKMGILNQLQKSIQTHVMVKSNGIAAKDIKQFPNQPIYVSAFDCT